ncbi:MAG: succinate dehydrogenase assembly factor 2 [Rhizobiales bacterium]|nr:succinate dehydrogenase assembly factor 2 [Hyphomicrobiales bacterium]NRB14801.1 succinate dehydrogenase assembly factor 2 [Hyphomicrobiales bacterium]
MQDIENYKKKLMFRAWHRGMKELDLLMGTFAQTELQDLQAEELTQFERLIDSEDNDLLNYFNGKEPVPAALAGTVFERIKAQTFTPDKYGKNL